MKNVPPKYVLQKWSENAKRKHTYIRSTYNTKIKGPHILKGLMDSKTCLLRLMRLKVSQALQQNYYLTIYNHLLRNMLFNSEINFSPTNVWPLSIMMLMEDLKIDDDIRPQSSYSNNETLHVNRLHLRR